jgi:hypothetical protein
MNATVLEEAPPQTERSSEPSTVMPLRRTEERGNLRKGPPEQSAAPQEPAPSQAAGEIAFSAIGQELERRSREWAAMVRLLDQRRQQLESAEADRDTTHGEFAKIVPAVLEAARELKDAMEATKAGRSASDVGALFAKNAEALERLENVAAILSTRLAWRRTTWDQYAGAIDEARRLKGEASAI